MTEKDIEGIDKSFSDEEKNNFYTLDVDKKMENVHPRDMSLYRANNVFKTLRKIMLACKEETMERELSNHTKLDQWIQYKNGSLIDDDEMGYNNTKSFSQQAKISLYYEKLKKITEVVLDNFEKKEKC